MSREAQGTGGRSRAKPSRQNKEFLLSYYPHSGQQPRLQGILAISFPLPITFCIWLFLILKNLEKAMATHSSTLAWKVPWTEEPGRLQSMGVAKSRTQLSNFTFTFHFHALKKEMATHSSVLAWRIPGMGEPGGLLSMGSHRVGHD